MTPFGRDVPVSYQLWESLEGKKLKMQNTKYKRVYNCFFFLNVNMKEVHKNLEDKNI